MDASLTAILDFSQSTRYSDLPDRVADRARDSLTDAFACAFGGRGSPGARVARTLAEDLGATGMQGAVIGEGEVSASADVAALWNTAMIRYLDFNDAYPGGHPSDMLGALIALTRGREVSGPDLLTAMVVAYETFIRLSEAVNLRSRAVDQGYAIGLGVVAGAANLLGLSREVTRNALAITAVSGIPLRATRAGELSDLKGVATAFAGQNAVRNLWAAQAGLTGPEAPIDGRHGVRELLEGAPRPVELEPFGEWKVMGTRLKYWPIAYNMQPSVWAGLELRERVDVASLESIVIHTDKFSHHESGSEPAKWDPRTRETADHSLPYVLARALERGTVDQAIFEEEAVKDPSIRDLMGRIEVAIDDELTAEWPHVMGVRLVATARDGRTETIELRDVKGHNRNPLGREDIAAKFRGLVEPVLGERWAAAFEAAWGVRTQSRIRDVLAALAV